MEEFEAFVGFDWGSEKHQACLFDGRGGVLGERELDHSGAGLGELIAWIIARTGARPEEIAVAIETSYGPVVEAFLERGFAVFAINPKQLDRFRDRFTVAGAKDDRRDAHVLGDSLRTDRKAFRRLQADDDVIIELREWTRMTKDLQEERTRLTNRMREQLWRYYPQALKLTDDLGSEWFLRLWQLAPTPSEARLVRKAAVERLFKERRIRRLTAEEALRILREQPLTVAPGTIEAATAHIRLLITRITLVNKELKNAHRKLDELTAKFEQSLEGEPGQISEQRDVAILRSLPGVGRITLATLLAEASQPLRQRDYPILRALSGVAPVTRKSGKTRIVLRRHACNKRLQQAIYHWARVAAQIEPRSRARYGELRKRGHGHARALRTIGDRMLFVACTLLERQVPFQAQGIATAPAVKNLAC
jgi:transposase